jgi:2-keto-4-pentenoate hydratase/2-oxohepta-3-ene-1,7-dioic acid hydratase in catechol pathway
VIGKDAKDVPVEEALNYVAAYTAGNDVSSRKLQRDPAYAGVVPQWGFSKGFDTFAPLGPVLVAASEIADPSLLHLKTIIDGEVRQEEGVSDLLFDCKYLISYLSQGTTLQKGSVIMTGTPGGKCTKAESQSKRQLGYSSDFLSRRRRGLKPSQVLDPWNTDGCVRFTDWHLTEQRCICLKADLGENLWHMLRNQ